MRPAFRRLLVRLKQVDPERFEEASRRYQDELEPAVAAGRVDPIAAWLDYGSWVAGSLARGRTLSIDSTGRARPFRTDVASPEVGLLIHLPDDERAGAILLAIPREPTEPQRVTADLLTD
jgi:hypothetical protein